MTKETHEHLSSLMDGEISRETSRFLVRRLGADDELCATWARYHLVRDCLRHQDGGIDNGDLCSKVRQALEGAELQKTASVNARRWLRPVAGMAVAASVALMAIVLVDPASKSAPPVSSELASSTQAAPFTSPQSLGTGPVSRQASLSGGLQSEQKMNSYLLRHFQAPGTSGKGFVTFVPIVITKNAMDTQQASNTDDQQSDTKSEDALTQ